MECFMSENRGRRTVAGIEQDLNSFATKTRESIGEIKNDINSIKDIVTISSQQNSDIAREIETIKNTNIEPLVHDIVSKKAKDHIKLAAFIATPLLIVIGLLFSFAFQSIKDYTSNPQNIKNLLKSAGLDIEHEVGKALENVVAVSYSDSFSLQKSNKTHNIMFFASEGDKLNASCNGKYSAYVDNPENPEIYVSIKLNNLKDQISNLVFTTKPRDYEDHAIFEYPFSNLKSAHLSHKLPSNPTHHTIKFTVLNGSALNKNQIDVNCIFTVTGKANYKV